jgi:FKBP-type peptidyl-prolyl cis-trans isomerase FklB
MSMSSFVTNARFVVFLWCAVAATVCVGLQDPAAVPQETPATPSATEPQESVESRASLIMGFDLVARYKAAGVELDIEALIRGIQLAAAGEPIPMSDEECQLVVEAFNRQVQAIGQQAMTAEAEKNRAAGQAYLEKNRAVEGFTVSESGVQYRVITAGTGATPGPEDFVTIHYTGKHVDGTVFESTTGREPLTLAANEFVRGMTEVLLKMKVGEKCELVIPASLGYGADGQPPLIGPEEVLIFEVELVGVGQEP